MRGQNDWGRWTLTCDQCQFEDGGEETDWQEAWAMLRGMGWRSPKIDGEYEDRCPTCVERHFAEADA